MKTKKGKAAGPSGLNDEMILGSDNDIVLAITYLLNCVLDKGKISNGWSLWYIINC